MEELRGDGALYKLKLMLSATPGNDGSAVALGEHLFDECVRRGWVKAHNLDGAQFGHLTPEGWPHPRAVLRIAGKGWDIETGVMPDD
jgi:hypothetical protein